MDYKINVDLSERINQHYLEALLKNNGYKITGLKYEQIRRAEDAINDKLDNKKLTKNSLDDFLVNEISHGQNRSLFITLLDSSYAEKIKNPVFIKSIIAHNNLPTSKLNIIMDVFRPKKLTLIYFDAQQTQDVVNAIYLCYAATINYVGKDRLTGDAINTPRTEYMWVSILPSEKKIVIKNRINKSNFSEATSKLRELYDEVYGIVQDLFLIVRASAIDTKKTLYDIYKDLTNAAEKPFREKVDLMSNDIQDFALLCTHRLGLPSVSRPVDLKKRLARLLERAAIQADFVTYEKYAFGKKGIVNRLSFSDQTGASVNAVSGSKNEGIRVADIYFDTRDTIEEAKHLEKLWVTWFRDTGNDEQKIQQIPTRLEVTKEYYVIHFLRAYTTKEMEEHVFLSIKNYETAGF